MRLYIAEKPSMGAEIAKCLTGPVQRRDGYLITKDGIVTWAFGHILRQAEPQEYDSKYKMWRAEDLPIIPTKWKMLIDDSCKKQFGIIKGLIAQADEIVHAGDPDREGQLLIDEVLDYLHCQKPVRRILLNALDERSIKKANAELRDNKDFINLKQSALARARADWLIGMNLSRAYTLAARRAGRKDVLPVGRVKTPTLALAVRRERELQNFKPVDYFIIKADFVHENGSFTATWKPQDTQPGLDSENRLLDEKIARQLLEKFDAGTKEARISSYQKTRKKEAQRLPFSLSALQVLAGRRYGYAPQLVLDTAQKLYEKKLTTYPRSDCEYLPQNQYSDAKVILANLAQCTQRSLSAWAQKSDLKIKSRAWNDKKISAHHAIIPTRVKANLSALSEAEQHIYFLIAQAYIAQFYPLYIYDQTKVGVKYMDEDFTASGRTTVQPGWRELYAIKGKHNSAETEEKNNTKNAEDSDESAVLPPMKRGDSVRYSNGRCEKKSTKPPTRFTAASLLAGMKEIHKYVKDPEIKKKLKDIYGIGTEATRATIIDDLVKRGFLRPEGKKKYLVPTDTAYMLIDALPDEMTYPDSTAVWEDYLHSLSDGSGSVEEFLAQQADFTRRLCAKANSTVLSHEDQYRCPRCKRGVMVKRRGKNGDFWGCSNFPACRMTCNDKDGKPDFAGRQQRQQTAPGAYRAAENLPPPIYEDFDMSDIGGFVSALDLITKENSQSSKPQFRPPKSSAAPLEKASGSNTSTGKYLCPKCKEGSLRRIKGRNGWFWSCSNYPHCTATYDDINGLPGL